MAILFTGAGEAIMAQAYPPEATRDDVAQRLDQVGHQHPRLMASEATFEGIRQAVTTSALHEHVGDLVIRQADALMEVEPVERVVTGRRLLGESRKCLMRTSTLAMAYHLTGDPRYAVRCQDEMLSAAVFSDWNPSHFLDVGEMTLALAIGYDWLYDQLDPEARTAIREAIIEKGLRTSQRDDYQGWVRATNNWGQVCHAGMVAGALAVLEDEPDLAADIVHRALVNVPRSMSAFAPKGSYPEGPGYWVYGTSFNVILIDLLDSVVGTDFGLSAAPGFAETGQYVNLMTGPSGRYFNYADGGDGRPMLPVLHWFAERYDRPDWVRHEPEAIARAADSWRPGNAASGGDRLFPLTLLWLREHEGNPEIQMPLHWTSGGSVPVSVHRSSWTDANAAYVGFKAGSPSAPHGQMDVGSFVLDADGVRWAWDLGAEGYHGIESRGMNLWSSAQDSDRWTIFRQSNSGHNTLVIDGQPQIAAGDAPITRFSPDPAFPHSVADLSAVYEGQADSVRRGIALLPSGEVLIQDSLTGLAPGSVVRWGMITRAEPGETGGAVLPLTMDGAELTLRLLSPDASWEVFQTDPPPNEWDSPNPGTRMVGFRAEAPESGNLELAVLATPGSCTDSLAGTLERMPLDPVE
jgi:hypothetical protein